MRKSIQLLRDIQASINEGRAKDWEPTNCITCPRKQGQIANDRCLQYQIKDRCWCPSAALRSIRAGLAAEGDSGARAEA